MPETEYNRFNQIAANYASSEVHASSPTIEKLQSFFVPAHNLEVCDIAAGAGHLSFAMALFANKIVCVDPAPKMLQIIRERATEEEVPVETIEASIESLELPEESFDLVMTRLAAHHFADIQSAIDKMVGLARKGGKIAIIDLAGKSDIYLDEINHKLEWLHDPTHGRSYTSATWARLFAREDLKIIHFDDQCYESPGGITVDTWCNVGASGIKAKKEIYKILSEQTEDSLKELGFSYRDGQYYYHVHTVFILAERL